MQYSSSTASRRPPSRDSEATLYPPSTASSMTLSDDYAPSQGSSKGSSRGAHARRAQQTVSPLLPWLRRPRHSCHIFPYCKILANRSSPCSPSSNSARSRSQVTLPPCCSLRISANHPQLHTCLLQLSSFSKPSPYGPAALPPRAKSPTSTYAWATSSTLHPEHSTRSESTHKILEMSRNCYAVSWRRHSARKLPRPVLTTFFHAYATS